MVPFSSAKCQLYFVWCIASSSFTILNSAGFLVDQCFAQLAHQLELSETERVHGFLSAGRFKVDCLLQLPDRL
jgi:hypothetical protein